MPSTFDPYMPRIRLQFAEAGVMSIGTVSCDDQIHQAVYLAYTPKDTDTPTMELELPPKSVEVIIQQLQEHANQARFINGERMLEYPKPRPGRRGPSGRKGKARQRKEPAGQQNAALSLMTGNTSEHHETRALHGAPETAIDHRHAQS
jgi:hypothetical protein